MKFSRDKDAKKTRSLLGRLRRNPLFWFVAVLVLFLSGCTTTTIIPPANPRQPTTISIVDYGRHASLVLPQDQGSVEYEYGEWKWFALNKTQSPRVFPALFWRSQGTLGRRALPYLPGSEELLRDKGSSNEVFSLQVSAEAAERLLEKLNSRYEANIDTEVWNAEWKMAFVKDPASYSGFHNCNHELAHWLRLLGCKTKGHATFARFRIAVESE